MFKTVEQLRTRVAIVVVTCCCTVQLAKGDDFGTYCSKPHCDLADWPDCPDCDGTAKCPDSWAQTTTETGIGTQTWTFAACVGGLSPETRDVTVSGTHVCVASAYHDRDAELCFAGFTSDSCTSTANQCPAITGGDGCGSSIVGDAAVASADDLAWAKVSWSADWTSSSLTLKAEHERWEYDGSGTSISCPGEITTNWNGTATSSVAAAVRYTIQNGTSSGPNRLYRVSSLASVDGPHISCVCDPCGGMSHDGNPRPVRIMFQSNEVEWSSPTQVDLQVEQGMLVIFDDNSTIVFGFFADEGYSFSSNANGSVSFDGAHDFTFRPTLRDTTGATITSVSDSFSEFVGDINADELVSARDRTLMVQLQGARIGHPHYPSYTPRADFDLNGVIDGRDLSDFDSLVLGR